MKKLSIAKTACVAGLAFACVFGVAGCGGAKMTGGVAATVNGVEIAEDDVTVTVESVRAQLGVTDEASWAAWMIENGYTPELVREEVLEGLIDQEVLRQGAEAMGIVVDKAEVDSYVESISASFESEAAWEEALAEAGMTEDEYREAVELALLSQGVEQSFATTEEPSAEDMLSYAQMYATYYDGAKRSSHILFSSDDEATAQEVLGKINSGELAFEDAAAQYSLDGSSVNGGDVGWDAMTSFVTEYQTALDGLSKGQVSGLVVSTYGIHIIKCTDEFNAPAEVTSVDQLPEAFVESIRAMLQSSLASEAYANWASEQRAAADIVINEIPTDVPYYVDLSAYGVAPATDAHASADADDAGAAEGSASGDGSAGGAVSSSDAGTVDPSTLPDSEEDKAEAAEGNSSNTNASAGAADSADGEDVELEDAA